MMNLDSMDDLKCPVCLDVFKDPTILNCGHTFCRSCLQSQDQLHINRASITCPVCRGATRFGRGRVAELTSNLLVKGLLDTKAQAHPPKKYCEFCPFHSKLYLDIFCVKCDKLICLSCYATHHMDHGVKKKEEIEGEMMKEISGLVEKGKIRKIKLERFKDEIEQQRDVIQCHMGHLEVQIRESFTKKVKVLEKQQEKLLRELDYASITLDSNLYNDCLIDLGYDIDQISTSITHFTDNNTDFQLSNVGTFHGNHSSFTCLKRLLSDEIASRSRDYVTACVSDAERCQFLPTNANTLDLGHLETAEYLKDRESHSDFSRDIVIDIEMIS